MSQKRTHRERNFSPLQDKTLFNVLRHMFVTKFGYENKVIWLMSRASAEPPGLR